MPFEPASPPLPGLRPNVTQPLPPPVPMSSSDAILVGAVIVAATTFVVLLAFALVRWRAKIGDAAIGLAALALRASRRAVAASRTIADAIRARADRKP